jgi:hypothetical protein
VPGRSADRAAPSAAVLVRSTAVSTLSPASSRASPDRVVIDPANVIDEGPDSGPAHVSSSMSARRARSLFVPLVIATTNGRVRCLASSFTRRTISALSPDWLTTTARVLALRIGRRKCSSSAASTSSAGTPRAARSLTAG